MSETSDISVELARSARTFRGWTVTEIRRWLAEWDRANEMQVTHVDIAELRGWAADEDGALRHASRGFFSVEGIDVHVPGAAVPSWQQPIIRQPEIGILGIVAARVDGVLCLLMQAKNEPGNPTGSQLSPTVQATRSNYTRAHGGRGVPYLDRFLTRTDASVIVDVCQSEQGSWFLHKRNRNMVVEVAPEIEVLDGFQWLTLAEVHHALTVPNLVNMDVRTVLSCLPIHGQDIRAELPTDRDDFRGALSRSLVGGFGSIHRRSELLAAVTEARVHRETCTKIVPLSSVRGWRRREGAIVHDSGAFFSVAGLRVDAGGREVTSWDQPMFGSRSAAIACFLVAAIDGVLHVLAQLRTEPGFMNIVEIGPTVQCAPSNYDHQPRSARPRFLDDVLNAPASAIRFDSTMSEEGGRFFDTCTRYLIVETSTFEAPPDFRWMTLRQLVTLLEHSHYVNVQARSLLLCLQSMPFADDGVKHRS